MFVPGDSDRVPELSSQANSAHVSQRKLRAHWLFRGSNRFSPLRSLTSAGAASPWRQVNESSPTLRGQENVGVYAVPQYVLIIYYFRGSRPVFLLPIPSLFSQTFSPSLYVVLPLASDSVSGSRCPLLRPIALYFPYPHLRTNFVIDSTRLFSSQSVRRYAMWLTHCPSRGQYLPPALRARMRGVCRFYASIPPHQPRFHFHLVPFSSCFPSIPVSYTLLAVNLIVFRCLTPLAFTYPHFIFLSFPHTFAFTTSAAIAALSSPYADHGSHAQTTYAVNQTSSLFRISARRGPLVCCTTSSPTVLTLS
ncbi:hypothetical protein C8J57DRAFT_1531889 [Mycena rebaudengoi]|nr:hypothetical protein C8J57DRAFT_1531889 [Mycena rebaudengoi]